MLLATCWGGLQAAEDSPSTFPRPLVGEADDRMLGTPIAQIAKAGMAVRLYRDQENDELGLLLVHNNAPRDMQATLTLMHHDQELARYSLAEPGSRGTRRPPPRLWRAYVIPLPDERPLDLAIPAYDRNHGTTRTRTLILAPDE